MTVANVAIDGKFLRESNLQIMWEYKVRGMYLNPFERI